jgi:hypothetical protein
MKKEKLVTVAARVTLSEQADLMRRATAEDRTISGMVRRAVRESGGVPARRPPPPRLTTR